MKKSIKTIVISTFFVILCAINLTAQQKFGLQLVSVSNESNFMNASNTIDNSFSTYALLYDYPEYVIYDCGEEKNLTEIILYIQDAPWGMKYNIQGSLDNSTWDVLYTSPTSSYASGTVSTSLSGTYRYIKLEITSYYSVGEDIMLYEVELYGTSPAGAWAVNESDLFYDAGNIGIGTSEPQEALHVNGNVRGDQYGALRINTGNGYVDVGPRNTAWAHFVTDREKFYFNKPVYLANGKLSSYSSNNLYLQTNGSTKMTLVNSTGNIGIGTSAPTEKLDVNGDIKANTIVVDELLKPALDVPNAIASSEATPATNAIDGNINTSWNATDYTTEQFIVLDLGQSMKIGKLRLVLGEVLKYKIKTSSDYWADPDYAAWNDLYDQNTFADGTMEYDIGFCNRYLLIHIYESGGDGISIREVEVFREHDFLTNLPEYPWEGNSIRTYTLGKVGIGTGTVRNKLDVEGAVAIGSSYSGSKYAPTNGLLVEGQVGIGTDDIPDGYMLGVKGKIFTDEVNVRNDYWSDYVFADDYDLRPLTEVESFIQKNKHLPGIPSEKVVLEKGIELGEMNAMLLEKIEELTLYVIELKKENEEQQQLIDSLLDENK